MSERENENEDVICDMTKCEIAESSEALSKQLDNNHPAKSGSYPDFIAVVKAGHEALLAQENYGKITRI